MSGQASAIPVGACRFVGAAGAADVDGDGERRRRVAQDASLRGRLPAGRRDSPRRPLGPACPGGRPPGTLAPLEHVPQVHRPIHHRPPEQERFHRQPGVGAPANLGLALGQEAQHPHHVPRLQAVPIALEALAHGLGQPLRRRAQLQHQERAEQLPGASDELGQVRARVHQAVHQWEDALRALVRHQSERLGVELVLDQPEHVAHPVCGDRTLAEAEALVEHRERVAHAAVRLPRDQSQGILVRGDAFGVEHLPQAGADGGGADPPEVESL